MQALKSLFSRVQVQVAATVPAQRPVELAPESLQRVGGGLPRVSDEAGMVVGASSVTMEDGDKLPRVS